MLVSQCLSVFPVYYHRCCKCCYSQPGCLTTERNYVERPGRGGPRHTRHSRPELSPGTVQDTETTSGTQLELKIKVDQSQIQCVSADNEDDVSAPQLSLPGSGSGAKNQFFSCLKRENMFRDPGQSLTPGIMPGRGYLSHTVRVTHYVDTFWPARIMFHFTPSPDQMQLKRLTFCCDGGYAHSGS